VNRTILLRLYARKDPKRKRMLYDLFKDTISMHASLSMIAELINQDLGEKDLIKAADVKYCRHYFLGKASEATTIKESLQPVSTASNIKLEHPVPSVTTKSESITWTDPDNLPTSSIKEVKSKFSKK
jgi:hypothetical protein